MTTPLIEARAFRIWQYANPRGWECSHEDICAATGLTIDAVKDVIRAKRWAGRLSADRSGWARNTGKARMAKGGKFDINAVDTVDLMNAGIFAAVDE